ncbi:hypothetical protein [Streptococcus pluranimalium]|uniref:hypothetical protein n=1 Tax=Streptococcus pluranimalium TaxID=82348 RepID=UPI003139DF89
MLFDILYNIICIIGIEKLNVENIFNNLFVNKILLINLLSISKNQSINWNSIFLSVEFISSVAGAIVGGLIALAIALLANSRQEKMSNELFNKQQLLEIKKIELNNYVENITTVRNTLKEIVDISESKLKPLFFEMIEYHENKMDLLHNSRTVFETRAEFNMEKSIKEISKQLIRLHEINNELTVLSKLFDTHFSAVLNDFVNYDFGLLSFQKQMITVSEIVEKHYEEQTRIDFKFENVEYEVHIFKIIEFALQIIQKSIPLEIDNKIKELKELYSK